MIRNQLDILEQVLTKVERLIPHRALKNPSISKAHIGWYLPRGKAQAPKKVLPPDIILVDDLMSQLKLAQKHIKRLKVLPKTSYFDHHVFGKLNKRQTLRFLETHTRHHLKIANEILKA